MYMLLLRQVNGHSHHFEWQTCHRAPGTTFAFDDMYVCLA